MGLWPYPLLPLKKQNKKTAGMLTFAVDIVKLTCTSDSLKRAIIFGIFKYTNETKLIFFPHNNDDVEAIAVCAQIPVMICCC